MRAARLVAACIVLLVPAAPAAAQGIICCMMLIDAKGEWSGAIRTCAGALENAPPEVLENLCEKLANCEEAWPACAVCDKEKIARLKGRIRGLSEAIAAHQKGRRDPELKRHAARDKLWGKGEGLKFDTGSIAEFGQAGLDSLLLATGGGGRAGQGYSKFMDAYDDLQEWVDRGVKIGTDPGSVEGWADLGQELLKMQADEAMRSAGRSAARAAREHFEKTGNSYGAQRVWRETMKGYGGLENFRTVGEGAAERIGKVAGALGTLANLYKKTDALANDLQSWIDAYKDQGIAEREIAKAEADRERTQAELSKALRACESLEGKAAGKTSLRERLALPPLAAPASFAPEAVGSAAAGASGGDSDKETFEAAEKALHKVRIFRVRMQGVDRGLGRQIVTPLSPWMTGVWREVPPGVLLALVKDARGDFKSFERSVKYLSESVEGVWKAVQAIPPDRGR